MNSSHLSRRRVLQVAGAGALGLLASGPLLAVTPVPAYRIGCYTRPWAKFEYTVALDAIAAAGFKYVGLMTAKSKNNLIISLDMTEAEAKEVGNQCARRGLKPTSIWGGGIPVQKSLEAGIEGLKKLIDHCAACGAINLLMGGVSEKLHDVYYAAIAACCDYGAQRGIGLSLKPHGGTNATGPQCRKAIEKVNHKNFRVWYDPGNTFYYSDGKLDPVDDVPSVDGLVVGMSVKDFTAPKRVDLTPGTGQVNFTKVMALLRKGGFTSGDLVIECLAPGEPEPLLAEAKKAREFVEKLVAG